MSETTARSDLALKPCPFCGSDDISHHYVRDGRQVSCQGCRASAPPTFHGPAGDTIERAIASWNTRAASQPDREAWKKLQDLWLALDGGPRPMCRDCADHDGACPNDGGLPCDPQERALEHIKQLRSKSDGGVACGSYSQASLHHNGDRQPASSSDTPIADSSEGGRDVQGSIATKRSSDPEGSSRTETAGGDA